MSAPTYGADLTIPSRYCGPPGSGNGGYTSGVLADRLAADDGCPPIEVTLRQPPPLDVAMSVQQASTAEASLLMGGSLIAEARVVDGELESVEGVSLAEAAEAMDGFPGFRSHPFPGCFACGPDRAEGDGLRIFPGPVGPGRMAARWVPHPTLAESSDLLDEGVQRVGIGTAWAALDCVGGWAGDMEERRMVLGRMTAQVDALPVIGEPHVVVGRTLGTQGRKTATAATLYDSDGRIVGRAAHVWIAVDTDTFR